MKEGADTSSCENGQQVQVLSKDKGADAGSHEQELQMQVRLHSSEAQVSDNSFEGVKVMEPATIEERQTGDDAFSTGKATDKGADASAASSAAAARVGPSSSNGAAGVSQQVLVTETSTGARRAAAGETYTSDHLLGLKRNVAAELSDHVALLQFILGDAVGYEEAAELLRESGNNTEAAVNAFFEGVPPPKTPKIPRARSSRASAARGLQGRRSGKRARTANSSGAAAPNKKHTWSAEKSSTVQKISSQQPDPSPQRSIKSFLSPSRPCQNANAAASLQHTSDRVKIADTSDKRSGLERLGGQSICQPEVDEPTVHASDKIDTAAQPIEGGVGVEGVSGHCDKAESDAGPANEIECVDHPASTVRPPGEQVLPKSTSRQGLHAFATKQGLQMSRVLQQERASHSTEDLMRFALLPIDRCGLLQSLADTGRTHTFSDLDRA
jgi:hypothetical protein